MPVWPDQHREVRSLGVEREGEPYVWGYGEGPAPEGQVRVDLLYTGLSAGTELTFLKGSNPYLHSRWDAEAGVFVPGEPTARFPVAFLGYMEVGRVVDAKAPGYRRDDVVAGRWGHKTGHTGDPSQDLLVRLPQGMDPLLGIFVAQMGPIAANGILHADALEFGGAVPRLGAGLAGRPVLVWGGGTVGLMAALFARQGGASEVAVAEPSAFRRAVAERMGLLALDEEGAWRHAKSWRGDGGRGAALVVQTRPRSESLHLALRALRPQGAVIDLAFYQGGADRLRLGEEFHHNGLSIHCAQINRVPRPLAPTWDQRRLALATLDLLAAEGAAVRQMVTHVVPFDDAPAFLRDLVRHRPDFLQIAFKQETW